MKAIDCKLKERIVFLDGVAKSFGDYVNEDWRTYSRKSAANPWTTKLVIFHRWGCCVDNIVPYTPQDWTTAQKIGYARNMLEVAKYFLTSRDYTCHNMRVFLISRISFTELTVSEALDYIERRQNLALDRSRKEVYTEQQRKKVFFSKEAEAQLKTLAKKMDIENLRNRIRYVVRGVKNGIQKKITFFPDGDGISFYYEVTDCITGQFRSNGGLVYYGGEWHSHT